MDVLGPVIDAGVVAAAELILGWLGKGDSRPPTGGLTGWRGTRALDRLRRAPTRLVSDLHAGVGGCDRANLTQVALAVGVRPRANEA
jgi:hypothetical protein